MRFGKAVSATLAAAVALIGSGFAGRASVYDLPDACGGTMSTQAVPYAVPDVPLVERYLLAGKLEDGRTALEARLKHHAGDDQARFGLGVLQFLYAVEQLGQDLYRHGPRAPMLVMPILRLPVPSNPHPEKLSYLAARKIIQRFARNLAEAEATLASISDHGVKLPLHFGMIRLDFTGDRELPDRQSLWRLYAHLARNASIRPEQAEQFFITFDRGDAHWLRGYCHLLMAVCDVYLAYDSRNTFDHAAHLFFSNVESPYAFLQQDGQQTFGANRTSLIDFVALLHTIHWPVAEPERMRSALHHLQVVVAQSKESWKWILAETDDDHEWIPNPMQTGVIPNVRVTEEMVEAWTAMMSEADKLLAGEVLIPFWRGEERRGVNLRKVFTEPRALDPIFWLQGPAAAPYLETGPVTDTVTWRRLTEVFGSNFPGFALWFN